MSLIRKPLLPFRRAAGTTALFARWSSGDAGALNKLLEAVIHIAVTGRVYPHPFTNRDPLVDGPSVVFVFETRAPRPSPSGRPLLVTWRVQGVNSCQCPSETTSTAPSLTFTAL
jgi:hypothetical protein